MDGGKTFSTRNAFSLCERGLAEGGFFFQPATRLFDPLCLEASFGVRSSIFAGKIVGFCDSFRRQMRGEGEECGSKV
jgi:hypothetical protein